MPVKMILWAASIMFYENLCSGFVDSDKPPRTGEAVDGKTLPRSTEIGEMFERRKEDDRNEGDIRRFEKHSYAGDWAARLITCGARPLLSANWLAPVCTQRRRSYACRVKPPERIEMAVRRKFARHVPLERKKHMRAAEAGRSTSARYHVDVSFPSPLPTHSSSSYPTKDQARSPSASSSLSPLYPSARSEAQGHVVEEERAEIKLQSCGSQWRHRSTVVWECEG
ncbi:hypothetical protein PENSPDRAFT_735400 [Peniophora sp. CONT]|nr:hypothetical protein PENSPDRAFT_735400 [Peniophora sp. CONT]